MNDLGNYLQSRRNAIDTALERFIPTPPACPPLIGQAMRYSLFAGGKRIRPILTLAAGDSVADHDTDTMAMPAACAIEMIHTYSLIHDDLPAMDNDALRRGRPTAHVVYGDGIAVLAGDALLTEAFHVLAHHPETVDTAIVARKIRTVDCIAEAAGVVGMVGGQAIDLQTTGQACLPETTARGKDTALDGTGLQAMHARKTGALIRAAVMAGAIMAGAPDATVDAMDSFGSQFGLAFQIVDDILDVEGATEELGKTTGKDAVAGKLTYPAFYGLAESRRLAAQSIDRAKRALSDASLGGHLGAIADWMLTRTH